MIGCDVGVLVSVHNSLILLQTYVNDERVQGEQGVWLQSYDQVRCGYGKG